ncbi:hypothetical protein [Roseovarius nanhaiticus]|uniref:Uncharacterized protein n=1 Tax=Roseovarius nanhaiticus TaxID=573024 RepID=A0A1N7H4L9_9RHOB|nr:hypothetical protein [Roseovarius nanhaiticus]SEL13238.1 hypothetical protein SAMN05216208_2830 [Roseovarius nanhaiticus]SIS19762.1 hypothetical protein SAMN05421666_2489 [Roseovarius nanhaiticus]
MSGKDTPKRQRSEAEIREDRLKQALKANMARRKAQARVRQAGDKSNDSAPGKGAEQEG